MSPHDDGATHDAGGPIEAYLDELFTALRTTPPRQARHLLAEAEGHLRDAAADAQRGGAAAAEAEAHAVTRFGSATELAGADRRQVTPLGTLARGAMASALFLGAIGAIAVGVSGIIAAVLGFVGGKAFIADTQPSSVLTASNCVRWLSADPGARTCHQAALSDWAFETVAYRVAFGVLGLVALTGFVVIRRRWIRAGRWTFLPSTVVDTVAVTLFAISGIWLVGLGVDAVIVSAGHGAGQWLSAAPVALGAAGLFGVRLLQDLRAPRAGLSVEPSS